jgi:hypothetical protein
MEEKKITKGDDVKAKLKEAEKSLRSLKERSAVKLAELRAKLKAAREKIAEVKIVDYSKAAIRKLMDKFKSEPVDLVDPVKKIVCYQLGEHICYARGYLYSHNRQPYIAIRDAEFIDWSFERGATVLHRLDSELVLDAHHVVLWFE